MNHESKSKADFFISRAGADANWAVWIARQLESAGYTTLFQDRDFLPGQSWVAQMEAGAAGTRTLAVLSPDYLKAPYAMTDSGPHLQPIPTVKPAASSRFSSEAVNSPSYTVSMFTSISVESRKMKPADCS